MCIEWQNALQAPRLATLTISRKDVSFTTLSVVTRLQLSHLQVLHKTELQRLEFESFKLHEYVPDAGLYGMRDKETRSVPVLDVTIQNAPPM